MKRLLLLGTLGLLAGCAESPTQPASLQVSAALRGNSANAKLCQKNGWTGLVTSSGNPFASEEACVSYAAKGGKLYRTQTISFTSTNPSPVNVGDPSYTPTATATSGLTVAFTLDGASTGCALTSGVVSFASAGTCVINANQAGNTDWYPAPQQTQSITILAVTPLTDQQVCEASGGIYTAGGTAPGTSVQALWNCYWAAPGVTNEARQPVVDRCNGTPPQSFVNQVNGLTGEQTGWCYATNPYGG